MLSKRKKILGIGAVIVVLLAVVISLPPVWSRVSYHSRVLYRTVKYWLKPPSEAVFVPSTSDEVEATAVSQANPAATATVQPTSEPTPTQAQATVEATSTVVAAPTVLPPEVLLTGFELERQFMNNCGPATLSVYLSHYNWGKDQIAAGAGLRPNNVDVNVMPYELVDYVNQNTELRALWRYGGDAQILKALVNAGFPVMIEKSFEPYSLRNEGWLGHYNLVVGYDDERESFTTHDTYLMSYTPWSGEPVPLEQWDTFLGFDFFYSELERTWLSFNYVFIVIYPPEREGDVMNVLGPLASVEEANQIAYDRAMRETTSLTDIRDQFFAWFNVGTSLVNLKDYEGAAAAFDKAFALYPDIEREHRPHRIFWYETGPYEAYYNVGRYQDVINLANQTLSYMAEPVLEESYYWRALSYDALGNPSEAIDDLRTSLRYHPGYAPSVAKLTELGLKP